MHNDLQNPILIDLIAAMPLVMVTLRLSWIAVKARSIKAILPT
jgi:hypothetical protein